MPRDLSDYVMVNERITAFREKYPEGSLQSEIVDLRDDLVVIKAFAFRTPDDPKPGIGHSALKIPGATPFTRGSEIENAETSAWGRALAALGFEVKRGIASAEEVANHGDTSVSITPSRVGGVSRGGRTRKANPVQVQQVRVASRDLDLGPKGMADLIEKILGDKIEVPEDGKQAAAVLTEYLSDLDSENIEKLLQVMASALEATLPDLELGLDANDAPGGTLVDGTDYDSSSQ